MPWTREKLSHRNMFSENQNIHCLSQYVSEIPLSAEGGGGGGGREDGGGGGGVGGGAGGWKSKLADSDVSGDEWEEGDWGNLLTDTPRGRNPIWLTSLDQLVTETRFSRHEIRSIYRGFKQHCPHGIVQEENFREIYAKFFPGALSTSYAQYVFRAFDSHHSGALSFRDLLMSLSTLLRGTIEEKLDWVFRLYDLNGDGVITRHEIRAIIISVHQLMGAHSRPPIDERVVNEQVERLFQKMDLDGDGVVSWHEFYDACVQVGKTNGNTNGLDWGCSTDGNGWSESNVEALTIAVVRRSV
ncbi:unnamed protein product [Darwinula stevensoni]|uniref:EF-hand domain-containing protein n=1 Tax=Darwinula stevensoni TaxID=69355 RepID=A0A7R9A0T9_9CRUS|nr:unnamed protein product [Darwinula stevensoni]CAG0881944.1 unnamed protein product [Darwinula stevensoni]